MTFEKHDDGSIMITGEDDIMSARMLTQIKALEVEIRTGMRMSNRFNLLKGLKEEYGLKSRTKKDALVEMQKVFNQRFEKKLFDV